MDRSEKRLDTMAGNYLRAAQADPTVGPDKAADDAACTLRDATGISLLEAIQRVRRAGDRQRRKELRRLARAAGLPQDAYR